MNMNTDRMKKILWLMLAVLLPLGFTACSDDDKETPVEPVEPVNPEPDDDETEAYASAEPYANFFGYNVMSDVYLWKDEIEEGLSTWMIGEDPIEKVATVRYKENGEDVDKWTQMTNDYEGFIGGVDGVPTTTYGCSYKFYLKAENSNAVVAFVTYTYPDSPAEEAGLQRGDVVLTLNGAELNTSNYTDLYYSSSMTVGVGKYENKTYVDTGKTVSMTAVNMYEDPVLIKKVFDCGGKKVGYLAYMSFTLESCQTLVDACKSFKQEGVTELILDLRYNGGGYVFTEEVLASMLAPEAEVKNGSVFETEVWNKDYMDYYKEKGTDLNTYFRTSFKQTHNEKTYNIDTSDANIGLTKIYALIAGGTASASEAVLVGLMPYMDIELIGEQSHGKYCTGIIWSAEEWYQDIVDYYKENNKDFAADYPEFAEWKSYITNWGIYVMINRYADKNGNNPCMPNGLVPDIEGYDLFEEAYSLGDERENLLNIALTRAGKTDLQERVASRAAMQLPAGKEISVSVNPLDKKLIYKGRGLKKEPRMLPKK